MRPERNSDSERQRRPKQTRGQISWRAFSGLVLLLAAPAFALYRLADGWIFYTLLGGWAALSFITYAIYASDKRKAEAGEWRTPESTLHLLEFAGGWAAAFIAQRKLRHKISKGSYQFTFWTIVVAYQIVAADCLLDWKIARLTGRGLVALGGNRKPEKPAAPVKPSAPQFAATVSANFSDPAPHAKSAAPIRAEKSSARPPSASRKAGEAKPRASR